MDDVKVRLKLIDDVSQGLTRLEQRLKGIQRQNTEQAKRAAQEQAQASNQANQQQLSGFQRLVQRERQLREQAAQRARQLAQEQAQAANQSNEQQLSGFQRLIQRERQLREQAAQRARQLSQEQARLAEQAARQEQEAAQRALQNINSARQRLGVRSHADILANMERVRGYYRTLAQSGTLSFREQAQAADRLRQRLQQLTNEMGHLTAAQKRYGALQTGAMVTGGVVGGVAGTAMAMKQPIKDALDYDKRVAYLTNTAFGKDSMADKLAGKKQLEDAIHKAAIESKGTVSVYDATEALDTMISSGIMSPKQSMEVLPFLAKTAGANNANPSDVARVTSVLYGTGTVTNLPELEKAHNMMVAAGQAGGFEYKNQVMYLPGQISAGKSAGITGLTGLRDILTMNQTSMLATGTPDQAGVATHNYLIKAASKDTARDYQGYMEDQYGIKNADLHKDLMKARSKGMNAMDFWQTFIDKEIAKDPQLAAYKKKLDTAKSPAEAKEALDAINQIGKGSVISEMFQEMRGQSAVLGYQNAPYREKVKAEAEAAMTGRYKPNETNFDLIKQTNAAKVGTLNNTMEMERKQLLDKATPTIGNAALQADSFAKNHPTLAMMAPAAPWVASGIGGAVAGAVGLRMLMPSAASGVASAAPSLTANASVAFSRLTSTVSGLASRATAVIGQTPQVLTNLSAKATGVISNATRVAAPYAQAAAPWLARAAGVAGAGYTGWQIGSAANPYINKAISKATGRENTLGTSIYGFFNDNKANKLATGAAAPSKGTGDTNGGVASALTNVLAKFTSNESSLSSAISQLMSWEPKPLPVEVNTQSHLTVSLAAGLVAQAQSSQSSSSAQKGANSSAVSTGNIWSGAPS